jgi:hypothetical protein
MNPIETIMYVALGFAPTLVVLEMSWRRASEKAILGKHVEESRPPIIS